MIVELQFFYFNLHTPKKFERNLETINFDNNKLHFSIAGLSQ